jgi:hypothetical protein
MMPRPRFAGTPGARPSALVLLGVGFVLVVGVASMRLPVLTPDVWWHLATGRAIATSGLPRTDPFSYTLGDKPWLVHEWLADRVLFGVYSQAGLLGVVWWRGLFIALAAALAYRLARRHASMIVVLPLMTLAAYAWWRNWIDRPQVWTFALLPTVLLALEADRLGHRRAAWFLPPLFALWVNVHGGFMLGLMIVLVWQAARVVERGRGGLRRAGAIAAACALMTLANPHGWEGAIYPLSYLGAGLRATVQEERPGALDSGYAWVHLGLAVALVVALAVRGRRAPLAHRLVGWLLAAVSLPRIGGMSLPFAAERHAPLLLLGGVPILCWQVETWLPAAWRAAGARIAALARTPQAWVAAAVLAAFGLWQASRALPRAGTPLVLPGRFPEAAVAWMADKKLPGNLINPYRWGGYLAFHLAPTYKVWIDSRGDLYGAERLREDEMLYRMRPGSEAAVAQVLERWDANVVVWFLATADFGRTQVHPFTQWLLRRPDWRLVFVDAPVHGASAETPRFTTAVFLREHARNAAWLDALPVVRLPAGGR